MKFIRTGKYTPEVLERLVEIDSLKEAKNRIEKMNYMLGFVKEQYPDDFAKYIENLRSRYLRLLQDDRKDENPPDLDEILSEYPVMNEHPELTRLVLNYFIQVLKLPAEDNLVKSEVINRDYYKSWSHISYPNLEVLTETIGRAEGIALYKRFITQHTLDNRDPDRKTYDNVESIYERAIEPREVPSDWVVARGIIGDGKYAFRNDNCVFINAVGEDLPDTELKYYVCCYGDYEKFKDYHDSIILTMEHTIAQGDPYCSRVLHDTRVDWDLKHPPKEFWDNIEIEDR